MSLEKITFGDNLPGYSGGPKEAPGIIVLQVKPARGPFLLGWVSACPFFKYVSANNISDDKAHTEVVWGTICIRTAEGHPLQEYS